VGSHKSIRIYIYYLLIFIKYGSLIQLLIHQNLLYCRISSRRRRPRLCYYILPTASMHMSPTTARSSNSAGFCASSPRLRSSLTPGASLAPALRMPPRAQAVGMRPHHIRGQGLLELHHTLERLICRCSPNAALPSPAACC
jgi:hypothetical protein